MDTIESSSGWEQQLSDNEKKILINFHNTKQNVFQISVQISYNAKHPQLCIITVWRMESLYMYRDRKLWESLIMTDLDISRSQTETQ